MNSKEEYLLFLMISIVNKCFDNKPPIFVRKIKTMQNNNKIRDILGERYFYKEVGIVV